jgi:hypothetical protein
MINKVKYQKIEQVTNLIQTYVVDYINIWIAVVLIVLFVMGGDNFKKQ